MSGVQHTQQATLGFKEHNDLHLQATCSRAALVYTCAPTFLIACTRICNTHYMPLGRSLLSIRNSFGKVKRAEKRDLQACQRSTGQHPLFELQPQTAEGSTAFPSKSQFTFKEEYTPPKPHRPERGEEQLKEQQTHDVLPSGDVFIPTSLKPQQSSDNGYRQQLEQLLA
eukprot:1156964-Pelagomonas_calceolata.AAC.5